MTIRVDVEQLPQVSAGSLGFEKVSIVGHGNVFPSVDILERHGPVRLLFDDHAVAVVVVERTECRGKRRTSPVLAGHDFVDVFSHETDSTIGDVHHLRPVVDQGNAIRNVHIDLLDEVADILPLHPLGKVCEVVR